MNKFKNMFKSRKEKSIEVSEEENMVKIVLEQLEIEKAAEKVLVEHLEHMISKKVVAGEDISWLAGHLDQHRVVEFFLVMARRYCACILENATLLREKRSFSALSPRMQDAVAGIVFVSRRYDPSELVDGLARLREAFKARYAPCGGDTWEGEIDCKVNERLRHEGDNLRRHKLSPENGEGEEEQKKQKRFRYRERKQKRHEGLVLKQIWIEKNVERHEEDRETDDDETINDAQRKELKFQGLVLDPSWIRDFKGYGKDTIYMGCNEYEVWRNEYE